MRSGFVVAAAAVTLLAGCAGVGGQSGGDGGGASGTAGATPSGTLKIMGFGGEDEVGQSRINAFKQAYGDVKVSNAKGDFDAQQFLTSLASGNPPDLVYMDRNLVGTYAKKNAVVPLEDCIKSQQIDTSQYREAALTSVTLDGKVYGIPEFYVVTTNLVDAQVAEVRGRSGRPDPDEGLGRPQGHRLPSSSRATAPRSSESASTPSSPSTSPCGRPPTGRRSSRMTGRRTSTTPRPSRHSSYTVGLINDQGGWTELQVLQGRLRHLRREEPAVRRRRRRVPHGELVRQRAARLHRPRASSSTAPRSPTARASR